MSWQVEISKGALKELQGLPIDQRKRISAWIDRNLNNCENPCALENAKKIKGCKGAWRWRVGRYRILGQLQDEILIIKVIRIAHRRDVYKNLP